ncbi:MAG: hypothetical protein NC311_18300, partial [Muribaculaceae bacterium]|nr:hypothetical protein [Muribaculaceae bacterium]
HYDDALLLEHFQTVGVHEGRQGNKNFNVAAYMDNCDAAVRDAFGGSYECYYFYWMLNQETEKSVVTTGDYRTWQAVELSWYQQDELEHVNAYRAEVGASPVEIDPEMVAFACVRAWYDAIGNVKAHDNLYHQSVDDAMDGLDILEFYENAVKCHTAACTCNGPTSPWKDYRESVKGHYEAMVLDTQRYFGSSNSYMSSQSGSRCVAEFDMFTPETPKTSR